MYVDVKSLQILIVDDFGYMEFVIVMKLYGGNNRLHGSDAMIIIVICICTWMTASWYATKNWGLCFGGLLILIVDDFGCTGTGSCHAVDGHDATDFRRIWEFRDDENHLRIDSLTNVIVIVCK